MKQLRQRAHRTPPLARRALDQVRHREHHDARHGLISAAVVPHRALADVQLAGGSALRVAALRDELAQALGISAGHGSDLVTELAHRAGDIETGKKLIRLRLRLGEVRLSHAEELAHDLVGHVGQRLAVLDLGVQVARDRLNRECLVLRRLNHLWGDAVFAHGLDLRLVCAAPVVAGYVSHYRHPLPVVNWNLRYFYLINRFNRTPPSVRAGTARPALPLSLQPEGGL